MFMWFCQQSQNIFIRKYEEYTALEAGFQSDTFPTRAGAAGKLPAIDVKLKGVTANTNPSKALYSRRFQTPSVE